MTTKSMYQPPRCILQEILNRVDAISLCNERLAAIVHIPADKRTFENTVKAFEEGTVAFKDMVHLPQFMSSVHSDKAVRSAASGLTKVMERFLVDIGTRRDLYLAIRELADRKPPLDAEDQLLLDRKLIEFQRNGLALPDEQLEECWALQERLGDVERKFVAVIKVWDTARRETDSRKPDENLINRCDERVRRELLWLSVGRGDLERHLLGVRESRALRFRHRKEVSRRRARPGARGQ